MADNTLQPTPIQWWQAEAAAAAQDPDPEPAASPDPEPSAEPASEPEPEPAAKLWPETWREAMAGDDKKELKQLQRYASPEKVWAKARELERRMSAGELRSALADDASEEEVAAWRKENGIPETPTGYGNFESLNIPEDDRPVIEGFLEAAHSKNSTPAQVQNMLDWYYQEEERQT